MLFHCRMCCYAIGVEAVVLRSVVWCTVCQLVSNSTKLDEELVGWQHTRM